MKSKIYDPSEHEIIKDQAGLKIQAGFGKPEKHTIKAFCFKPGFRPSRVKTLDYYVQAQVKEKGAGGAPHGSPGPTSGTVTGIKTSELSVDTSH